MNQLKYLNKYFYRYKHLLLLGILFVMVSNYFRILQPQMIREALDLVVVQVKQYKSIKGTSGEALFLKEFSSSIFYFGGIVLVCALLMGVFMFFMRQTIIVMSRLIEYDMRKDIFSHYEKLTTSFYKQNKTGDLMARVSEDVSKVRMYVGPAVLYGINLISLFILVIYSMVKVNPELTFYSLLPLPFLSFAIYKVSAVINQKSTVIQTQLSVLNTNAQESFSGIRVVKSYVQEESIIKSFESEVKHFRKVSLDLVKVNAFFYPSMLLLIGASVIITTYVGGLKVISGQITAGNIAEFVIYVNMLIWPVTSIGWIASLIQQASASQQRINEFLFTKPEIENKVNNEKDLIGKIEFDDVSFVYPDSGIKALNQLSFDINPGERIAIIGKTGSGKTTIAELIMRMYDVTNGAIKIDDENIKDHDLVNLRHKIAYVPQDIFLFSETVANNISFGKPDATQEEIEKIAMQMAVHQEILTLPEGYNTIVGERGVTLSGGQKQRISMARALIKNPDILLLDDCLSAVDTNTEQLIVNSLNELMNNKTLLIITHRIYAKLNFDKIIVIDQGTIIEQGSHSSLLEQKGYYYELYQQQKMEEIAV